MNEKKILENLLKDYPDDVAKIAELGGEISADITAYLTNYCDLCIKYMKTKEDARLLIGSIISVLLTVVTEVVELFPTEIQVKMLKIFVKEMEKWLKKSFKEFSDS